MSCVGTYSPEFTDVVISNDQLSHIVNGYAEGTFISIEPFEDRITPMYGAKGEAYRAVSAVRAFDMTITLSQTSHSNDVLTQILRNDRESLEGTFTVTMKDSSGTTVFTERCAYIGTEPSQSFSGGGTIESREWSIHLPNPDYVIGGNGKFSTGNQNDLEAAGGNVPSRWQAE